MHFLNLPLGAFVMGLVVFFFFFFLVKAYSWSLFMIKNHLLLLRPKKLTETSMYMWYLPGKVIYFNNPPQLHFLIFPRRNEVINLVIKFI